MAFSVKMFVFTLLLSVLILNITEALPIEKQSREVQVNNELAINLLQSLSHEDNTVFSPLSLSSTLLTLLLSAKEDSEKDLKQFLDIKDNDDLKTIISGFKNYLKEDKKSLQLLNKILVSKQIQEEDQKEDIKERKDNKLVEEAEQLKNDVQRVDFKDKKVRKELNSWIKDKSHNKIPLMVKDLSEDSQMAIFNSAIFGSKELQKKFKKEDKRDFHNFMSYQMPGLATRISFMSTEEELKMKTIPELKSTFFEIPLKENFSLIIIFPNSNENLQFLNENMTSIQLSRALNDLENEPKIYRKILLPKFRMESDLDLKEPLEEVFELKNLFSAQNEFNRKISQFSHKALFEVNEEGETAQGRGEESGLSDRQQESTVVDRPFVFLVRDNRNSMITFIGRVLTLIDERILGLGFIGS